MDSFLDFIEKRRWGILATFLLHVGLLLYLQVDTYKFKLPERDYAVMAEIYDEELIEIKPEQLIPEDPKLNESFTGDVRNITQNVNDKREKSYDNFSKSSTDQKVEQNVKDLERQFFEEFSNSRGVSESGDSKSSSGSGGSSSGKSNNETKPNKDQTSASSSSSSSEKQFAGTTMVKYELKDRFPHNNNDWNIRNPGYTCGSSANGVVVVAIRVNQNGDVLSARHVPERSTNANSCMIEQAETYAKKSRFAFKNDAPKTQEGFIYYTFVSKK